MRFLQVTVLPSSNSFSQDDAQVISRIVDICVKEQDVYKRVNAENALECAIRFQPCKPDLSRCILDHSLEASSNAARFSSLVKVALSKAIDTGLIDTNVNVRYSVLGMIDSLTVMLLENQRTGTIVILPIIPIRGLCFVAQSARFFRDEVVVASLPHVLKVAIIEMGSSSTTDLRTYARSIVINQISKDEYNGTSCELCTHKHPLTLHPS